MHFISLVTVEIPKMKEDYIKNQLIQESLQNLKAARKQNEKSILLEFQIGKLMGLTTEFARRVDFEVGEIMMPYNECTEDPKYLEFDDRTEELKNEYFQGTPDCIRLPNGSILESNSYPIWDKFVISDGKVFQKYAGPLHHMKRTKKAKKMTAIPAYPRTKLFKSFEDYAEECGVPFDSQKNGYGYWYNPNAMWDWYSIGGRWPNMFLVKDVCTEISIGERSWCNSEKEYAAPEGYMWVCAARNKDIDWKKMREWNTFKVTEDYEKLRRMFTSGSLDEGFCGQMDEEGIFHYGERLFYKDDTLDSYLQRQSIPAEWKYPIYLHDIVDADDWRSRDDIMIGKEQKPWHTRIDEYIDSLDDDTVLVGVDYHM